MPFYAFSSSKSPIVISLRLSLQYASCRELEHVQIEVRRKDIYEWILLLSGIVAFDALLLLLWNVLPTLQCHYSVMSATMKVGPPPGTSADPEVSLIPTAVPARSCNLETCVTHPLTRRPGSC